MTGKCAGRGSTNTYSYFFREKAALEMVRDTFFVPRATGRTPVSIWCVGCATGEEPYSLAIEALEVDASVAVIGSDINEDALARARSAVYQPRSLRYVDELRRGRWFSQQGSDFVLSARPRGTAQFMLHDVTTEPPLSPPGHAGWDVIFCRNVFIYYAPDVVAHTVSALLGALAAHGHLILGAGEWLGTNVMSRFLAVCPEPELRAGVLVYGRGRDGEGLALPARPAIATASDGATMRSARSSCRLQAPKVEPQALESPPANLDDLRRRGDSLLDTEHPAAALAAFTAALAVSSLMPDLYLRIAMCHLRMSDAEAAREALRRSLFLDADLWPAALMLGELLEQQDPGAASRYYLQARDRLRNGRYNTATASPELRPFFTAPTVASEAIRLRLAALAAKQP